jgi:hypothetical protein
VQDSSQQQLRQILPKRLNKDDFTTLGNPRCPSAVARPSKGMASASFLLLYVCPLDATLCQSNQLLCRGKIVLGSSSWSLGIDFDGEQSIDMLVKVWFKAHDIVLPKTGRFSMKNLAYFAHFAPKSASCIAYPSAGKG